LNHPHIAAIYGLENADGVKALVMELVEGPTLADRIAQGPIPLDEALLIAKQIAEALEAAHEQGIIHRDLKPANIKVRPDGIVKVLDFGLAKAMEPAGPMSPGVSQSPTITTPAVTQAGLILGTAAYMSPEQARGKPVDKRTDIWAFGTVLFEMLTGARAFAGDDVSDVLASVLAREPDWARLPATLSPVLGTYIRRSLHKNPTQRVADVQDLRLALEGAFDVAAPRMATMAPELAQHHAREYLAWGLATVATLLTIGVSVLHLRAPRQAATLVRFSVFPPADEVRPLHAGFGLAPDGQTLAFTARGTDGCFGSLSVASMRRTRSHWQARTGQGLRSGHLTAEQSGSPGGAGSTASRSTGAPLVGSATCPAIRFVVAPGARAG
jgi:serine/threonine-protein kinase